jgi:hypothetical protein
MLVSYVAHITCMHADAETSYAATAASRLGRTHKQG